MNQLAEKNINFKAAIVYFLQNKMKFAYVKYNFLCFEFFQLGNKQLK